MFRTVNSHQICDRYSFGSYKHCVRILSKSIKAIKSYETLKFGEIRVFVSTLGTSMINALARAVTPRKERSKRNRASGPL